MLRPGSHLVLVRELRTGVLVYSGGCAENAAMCDRGYAG
jgi:hypothetical protein